MPNICLKTDQQSVSVPYGEVGRDIQVSVIILEDMGSQSDSPKNPSAKNCFLTLNLAVISTPCLADKE